MKGYKDALVFIGFIILVSLLLMVMQSLTIDVATRRGEQHPAPAAPDDSICTELPDTLETLYYW